MAVIADSAAREPGGTPGEPAARRCGLLLLLSAIAGFLLTVVRSAEFVDQAVDGTIAKSLLGHDPGASAVTSALSGTVLAFVPGLAGTRPVAGELPGRSVQSMVTFGDRAGDVGAGTQRDGVHP